MRLKGMQMKIFGRRDWRDYAAKLRRKLAGNRREIGVKSAASGREWRREIWV